MLQSNGSVVVSILNSCAVVDGTGGSSALKYLNGVYVNDNRLLIAFYWIPLSSVSQRSALLDGLGDLACDEVIV